MSDNIIAVIIFVLCIIGLIALVVYKMKKDNNNKFNIDKFFDAYYVNFINVIQDVVSILCVNIDNFETKEEYERAIISATIAKLEENCDEFGIDSTLFRLVDRNILVNFLYDILYTNKVQIFFNSLSEKIINNKPELYDNDVIEAFKNSEPALNEDENTHTESQEEPEHEEEKVVKQEETITDVSNNEETEEIKEVESVNDNTDPLPPREEYYGKENKESIVFTEEDIVTAELEITDNTSELFAVGETFSESGAFAFNDVIETAEQLADLAELPNNT